MSAPSLCCRSATRQLSGVSLPLVRGEIFDLRQQCQIAAWYIARSRMNSLAKIFAVGSLVCVSAAAFAAQRDADTYPTRPIRLMVPQNPGASVDNISRILAARMGEELGQQIVADNRPGAGGTLAAEVVAHAVPDGQTLFAVATGTAVISPQTFKKLSLRSDQRLRIHFAVRHYAERARGAPFAAGEKREGTARVRESQSRQAQHGQCRIGVAKPSRLRAFHAYGRHRRGARAL